jgi:hypothetical protein
VRGIYLTKLDIGQAETSSISTVGPCAFSGPMSINQRQPVNDVIIACDCRIQATIFLILGTL